MGTADNYRIYRTILFETGHGIALGCTKVQPDRFAVWHFTETAYGRDYYWRRDFGNKDAAERVFQKKAHRYWELYGVREKVENGTAVFYRYYFTQRPVDVATFPAPRGNFPLVLINYNEDRWRPVAGGTLYAWGELTYTQPLTEKQTEDYELTPAPQQARKNGDSTQTIG